MSSPLAKPKLTIEENKVINVDYFLLNKDHIICGTCFEIPIDPLMCSTCEKTFCVCMMGYNGLCPFRCSPNTLIFKELNITKKNLLDSLLIRCEHKNCEVPLLSYKKHIIQCQKDHINDVICWNCKITKINPDKLVIAKNKDYIGLHNSLIFEQNSNKEKDIIINDLIENNKILNKKKEMDSQYISKIDKENNLLKAELLNFKKDGNCNNTPALANESSYINLLSKETKVLQNNENVNISSKDKIQIYVDCITIGKRVTISTFLSEKIDVIIKKIENILKINFNNGLILNYWLKGKKCINVGQRFSDEFHTLSFYGIVNNKILQLENTKDSNKLIF